MGLKFKVMSKVIEGNLLGTSGKVGALVVVNIHGQQILRAKPKTTTQPRTPKQKLTTQRFQIATQFMHSYKTFAKQFFGVQKGFKSCYNQAMGNVLNALHCNMEQLTITMQYPNLQFAKGKGLSLIPVAITQSQSHTLKIEWLNNSENTNQAHDKLVILMAIDGNFTSNTYFITTTTTRQNLYHEQGVPINFLNNKIHVWVAFINTAHTQTSNSTYLGAIQLS